MRAEAIVADDAGAFVLEQRFRYSYSAPVRRLRHRLVVVPRAVHGGQRRIDYGLTITGNPVMVTEATDRFGNHLVELRAHAVDEWIEFESWSRVASVGCSGMTTLPGRALSDRDLLDMTPLTTADGVLVAVAMELTAGTPVADGVALAERICGWVHQALTYEYGITGVRTTAAEARFLGRGVCQDYAHVMLALCHLVGLPARYVSGHLIGEGGSHAWVEVIVEDRSSGHGGGAVALAFDPTHDRRANAGYLTVAVGRDYDDVAPTSGTYEGPSTGSLSAEKRLRLLGIDNALAG